MGGIKAGEEQAARAEMAGYRRAWTEILPSALPHERAVRLLSVHDLQAADALQLAAAVAWAGDDREGQGFVCLDERLTRAAPLEGFCVQPVA
jgi:hypothetical protein